jgi:hypothetical protein
MHSVRALIHELRLQLTEGDHKGTWWLPHVSADQMVGEPTTRKPAASEADAVLQLAAKQRMNTDSRRAIFCILMSADDYVRPCIAGLAVVHAPTSWLFVC